VISINIKLYPEDTKRIVCLYESGESIFTLAKTFNVNPTTIWDHLIKSGVKRRSSKEAGILASERGRLHGKHNIPESSRKMTVEKAYILGVMCGDGCLHRTKNDSYQITLQVIDEDFVDRFVDCMRKVYGLKVSVTRMKSKNPNWNDRFQARFCCKDAFNDILNYSPFGTYKWRVPSVIFNSSDPIKYSFLRGFFDSEGCVDKSKKIVVASVSKGIYGIMVLLSSLDIKSNIRIAPSTKKNWRRAYKVKITGIYHIESYNRNIGFSIKRKQEKLETLIKSYKLRIMAGQDVFKLKDRIIELRRSGLSYQQIGNELNIGTATAWHYVDRYG